MPVRLAHACALALAVACGGGERVPTATEAPPSDSAAVAAALRIVGDPASTAGATWTYRATVDGVVYDLEGILRKPAGAGPFPAVVVSHGAGGSAANYSRNVGGEMVRWGGGLVVIGTNYTHAGGAALGAPGAASEVGASRANVLRAQRLLAILRALGYVDMRRVAAHGHSMGAFVTAALVGASPDAFRVASHTAGGVRPPTGPGAAPVDSQVLAIRAPYQMHHGERDAVVALALDQRLDAVLAARGVTHELIVHAGADHDDVALSPVVLEQVRRWYAAHGMF